MKALSAACIALLVFCLPAAAFDEVRAVSFIQSLYDPSRHLVRECPRCSAYWLWSDNFLAQIVLRAYDPTMAAQIAQTIDSSGITMHSAWAVLDSRHHANVSFGAVTDRTARGDIRYSDYAGDDLSCVDFADVAFLAAIARYRAGDLRGARTCYLEGKAKWDGSGFHERWQPAGRYAVYKTALGLLAQKLTRFPAIAIPADYFDRFQGQDGGVRTDIVDGRPSGSENVETTAAVILAEDPALLPHR